MEKKTDRQRLAQEVLESFYTPSKALIELTEALSNEDPCFMGNLILHTKHTLRNTKLAHLMAVILANQPSGKTWTESLLTTLIATAADTIDLLEVQLERYGKPIPNGMKKAIASAFRTFTEEAWQGRPSRGTMTYRDVFRLTHPKPRDSEQNEEWRRWMEKDALVPVVPVAYTKEMARQTLREELAESPRLPGKTVFACDWSYSMGSPLPASPLFTPRELTCQAMLLHHLFTEEALFIRYGAEQTEVTNEGVELEKWIQQVPLGTAMDAGCVLDVLIERNMWADRLILFTDRRAFHQVEEKLSLYRRQVNPSVWIHLVHFTLGEDYMEKEHRQQTLGRWRHDLFSAISCIEQDMLEWLEQMKG